MFAFLVTAEVPQSDAWIACAIDTDAGTPNLRCVACAALTRPEMNLVLLPLAETASAEGAETRAPPIDSAIPRIRTSNLARVRTGKWIAT